MTRFIIVRHGYSENNKEKKFTGHIDVNLDEIGYRQAEDVKNYVLSNYKVDKVYSSDLKRAYETVKPIAVQLNLPLVKMAEFREINVGKWQGMTFDDVAKNYPNEFGSVANRTDSFRYPGGESVGEMKERFISAIDKIAEENENKTIVIGTHGGAVRLFVNHFEKSERESIAIPNGSITVFTYDKGNVKFEKIGFCEHLSDVTK